MTYTRSLQFEETPNYDYMRGLFTQLYEKCAFENEFVYDWTIQRFNIDFSEVEDADVVGDKNGSGIDEEQK